MNLTQLKKIFSDNGCLKIYVKILSPNDNSKNQVYFSGSFDVLNVLPIKEIKNEAPGDWSKERFKAKIDFSWIDHKGEINIAPKSQLILYPKYPEVRFSGFLLGCKNPPSELMTQRTAGRLFFFSVSNKGMVLGHVSGPDSEIAREFNHTTTLENYGVFKIIELPIAQNNREKLISELLRIHQLGWIKSKRLNREGMILSCDAPNCGGYTLEAELGITPNGYSEPDFLGWEVKQFGVANFARINSKIITLMTPEPTNGLYKTEGAEVFVRKYGYADISGREDRMNFGGIHKSGIIHPRTKLTLELIGFDSESGKIRNTDGRIALLDENQNEAASWSFSSMLLHWNRKHNQACYVPSLSETNDGRNYKYGNKVILGTGTDFQLFLKEMSNGHIYYDPGIKVENLSTKPTIKKRSQFRIKSENLVNLYKTNEIIDITA
ncbi:MvaI/BcnI family restriction endonuclease [Flavobacterium sp. S87F.05.LMB.W.Kidney.N]|uniref:MvaI/BcnI family restriction endonuclease n=1 Tax=Flavobacterium sp. S87F.05.LMB.W.Kidney.N TaxID=1278758 RepID=UPI001065275B|nr:MvaI/BcnI family restriction endonuclease [Flavobacterium sp. S87F.05.LMB.W.Kidney.N]TDX13807.1 MvaI/BcnI restriction endonuclease family protein [Flavobacterium sp. S87F.05.LMB.W.Kidney.N]